MKRLPGWPELLSAFVESRRDQPFVWGTNDCALFAADAVQMITGIDIAAEWRGYKTAEGAAVHIKNAGSMHALAVVAGLEVRHKGFAQRGDVVLADVEDRETFGIVVGDGNWCGPGADGLLFRPMNEVLVVFGV